MGNSSLLRSEVREAGDGIDRNHELVCTRERREYEQREKEKEA
jgi:hypothetical protein